MAYVKLPPNYFAPPTEIIWSEEQDPIFEWFATGAGNLVIRARAGCGKTTTLIEGVNRAPEARIRMAAFNKSIANELQERIINPRARAQTLHALGMSFCMRQIAGCQVDSSRGRAMDLAKLAIREIVALHKACVDSAVISAVATLHTKMREILVDPDQRLESLKADAEAYSQYRTKLYTFAVQYGDLSQLDDFWSVPKLVEAALLAVTMAKKPTKDIDFADMIFLPLVHKWTQPVCDLMVIDECQDMNAAQIQLALAATSKRGRLCVCGDDRQCHPAGTQILLEGGGVKPIESIRVGDRVVSYHDGRFLGLRTQGRSVERVQRRRFTGEMLTLEAAGRRCNVTPNHRVPTRVFAQEGYWALYLMECGTVSRIGCAQLFYQNCFGVGTRCHQERADRAWILQVFTDRESAQIEETLVALRFGLPEGIFFEKGGLKERLLAAIGDNRAQASQCLRAFNRYYEYPLWQKGDGKHIGRYIYVTEACNLIEGVNELRTFDGSVYSGAWAPVAVSRRPFVGDVWSLKVTPTEGGLRLYVADNVLVHNSIYGFRGADSGSLDRLKDELHAQELGLKTTFRCAQSVVSLARAFVPDFQADENNVVGGVQQIEDYDALANLAQPGDFVLGRTNKAVIRACQELNQRGCTAYIKGSEFAREVLHLLEKLVRRARPKTVADLQQALVKWSLQEEATIVRKQNVPEVEAELLARVRDQAASLDAFLVDAKEIDGVRQRIRSAFSDAMQADAVMCSTVHKAKGLEAPSVFLLAGSFCFGRGGEEGNICYVAVTRAKSFVGLLGCDRQDFIRPPEEEDFI